MTDETRDIFDRVLGNLIDRQDVFSTRPSTVMSVEPILGDSETYVVRTMKTEFGNYGFIQVISRKGGLRFVLPPKAMQALYRQQAALVKASRSSTAKNRWQGLTDEEKAAKVSHLRKKPA